MVPWAGDQAFITWVFVGHSTCKLQAIAPSLQIPYISLHFDSTTLNSLSHPKKFMLPSPLSSFLFSSLPNSSLGCALSCSHCSCDRSDLHGTSWFCWLCLSLPTSNSIDYCVVKVMVTFLIVVTKCLTDVRADGFVLAHTLRGQSRAAGA